MTRFVEMVLVARQRRVPARFPPACAARSRATASTTRSRSWRIKIAAPGVPDFYQGTELWDFSLVDPDNRRPVDYGRGVDAARELRCHPAEDRRSFQAAAASRGRSSQAVRDGDHASRAACGPRPVSLRTVRPAGGRGRRVAITCSLSRASLDNARRLSPCRASSPRSSPMARRRSVSVWGDTRDRGAGRRAALLPAGVHRGVRDGDRAGRPPVDPRRRCVRALPDRVPGDSVAVGWTIIAVGFIVWFVVVLFFTPRIDYSVSQPLRPDSDEFLYVIQSTCQATIHSHNNVDIFTNGAQFYPAMRDAIRAARIVGEHGGVHLPARRGRGHAHRRDGRARPRRRRRPIDARRGRQRLACSARRCGGCARRAARSTSTRRSRWYRFHRLNNRTHRELLVVDGRVAFTGGAGVADWWLKPQRTASGVARHDGAHRRADRGGAAGRLRRELARVLRRDPHRRRDTGRALTHGGAAEAMLVKSSPSDRSTASRVVFQMLIEGAVTSDRHPDAVLPAGQVAAARADSRRAARRRVTRHRAREVHRSADWCGWPAGACIASCSRAASASSSTAPR